MRKIKAEIEAEEKKIQELFKKIQEKEGKVESLESSREVTLDELKKKSKKVFSS